jgi:AcrR family transcriptional regulator
VAIVEIAGSPCLEGRGDARDVPVEAEILARGLTAFAELGYDGASVRVLARRLG